MRSDFNDNLMRTREAFRVIEQGTLKLPYTYSMRMFADAFSKLREARDELEKQLDYWERFTQSELDTIAQQLAPDTSDDES